MNNKNVFRINDVRGRFCAAILGALMLAGCVVEPAGGVAYVAPEPVMVAPVPVVVGPEVVVPVFVGGGGRSRR